MESRARFERAEELFADAAWVRRLALALVGDPHRADDLAQEACLAALEADRAGRTPGRGWLVGVLRNLARKGRRTEARRREREERGARPESGDPAGALRERAELHRDLVAAVLALDEPCRTAVLLRYLDDLPPREIARRLEVPLPTVSARLRRGLERLQVELDRRGGGRAAWLPGAIALAGADTARGAGILGGVLMGAKTYAAIAVGIAAVAALVAVRSLGGDAESSAPASDVSARAPDAAAAPPLAVAPRAEQRIAVGAGAAASAPALPTVPGRVVVRARVLDGACAELGLPEAPTAEVAVRVWAGAGPLARPPGYSPVEGVARGGAFAIEFDDPGYRPLHLLVRAEASPDYREALVQVAVGEGEKAAHDVLVVRPPHGVLHGVVRDGDGAPLAGVLVTAPVLLKGAAPVAARTDAAGAFALAAQHGVGAPSAQLDGWVVVGVPEARKLPEGGYEDVEIVLAPAGMLIVHVKDAAGRPVPRHLSLKLAPEEFPGDGPPIYFSADAWRAAKTDAAGTAAFERVWTGRKLLLTVSRDTGSAEYDKLDGPRLCRVEDERGAALMLPLRGSLEVEAVVPREIVVRGSVVLPDGAPVPEPGFQLATSGPFGDGPANAIDGGKGGPDGRFEVRVDERLARERLWVLAADGAMSSGWPVGGGEFERAACAELDLAQAREDEHGERVLEVDLRLAPTASISGTLVDETGAVFPPNSCAVQAVPVGAGRSFAPTALGLREEHVGADGAFRLDHLPTGLYDVHALRGAPSILASGFCAGMVTVRDVPAGTSGLRIVLPRAGGVRVRVELESAGAPPDSMTVTIGWLDPTDGRAPPAESPETIRGGALGAWRILPARVDVAAPEGVYRFEQYATAEVAGHALRDLGEGWYVIAVVPRRAGAVSHVPVGTEPVYLRAGERVVRFALTPAAPLAGRVVGSGPVAHLAVALVGLDGALMTLGDGSRDGMRPIRSLTAAGAFRIAAAPVGTRTLRVGTPAQLARGEFLRELEIEVPPADGKPLEIRL